MNELSELAGRLLAEGQVGVVIGWEAGPRGLRPAFVTDAAGADRLVFDRRAVHNLAAYLNPRRRHLAPLGKKAVVVKACDARAVAGLVRESQLQREDVVLIGVRCGGVAASPEGAADAEAPLAGRCLGCTGNVPHGTDYLVGPEVAAPAAAEGARDRVAALDAMSADERWAFWSAELERCVRCHACREVCPLCFCDRCLADKAQPQWIEGSPHLRGNIAWHISRALHLAGRCAGCGECERACPAGIPLGLIARKMARVVEQRFDYRVSDDPAVPAPVGTFRADDAQEFIR